MYIMYAIVNIFQVVCYHAIPLFWPSFPIQKGGLNCVARFGLMLTSSFVGYTTFIIDNLAQYILLYLPSNQKSSLLNNPDSSEIYIPYNDEIEIKYLLDDWQ